MVLMASPHSANGPGLSISADEGKTWSWHRYLEHEKEGQGSFSYPSIIQDKDGLIHVTYSSHLPGGMKSITYAKFNQAWVQAGD